MPCVLPGKVDNWASEPNVPVNLCRSVVMRSCRFVGSHHMLGIRRWMKREKALERRLGEPNHKCRKSCKDGCVISCGWRSIPGSVISSPGSYDWNICLLLRVCPKLLKVAHLSQSLSSEATRTVVLGYSRRHSLDKRKARRKEASSLERDLRKRSSIRKKGGSVGKLE